MTHIPYVIKYTLQGCATALAILGLYDTNVVFILFAIFALMLSYGVTE
jgi:hypothetical protein